MADAYDNLPVKEQAVSGNSGVSTGDLLGEAQQLAFGSPARAAGSSAESRAAGLLEQANNLESAAKHLDFGAPHAPPTPATPVAFQGSSTSADIDYNQFVLDTLLWKNKIRSAFYLTVGLIQAFVVHKIYLSGIPVISGLSFLLLANLAANFLRSLVTSRPSVSSQWSGSSLSRTSIYLFTEGVNAASAVLDKHLSGTNPGATLQVAVGLWALSLIARGVSAFSLMVSLYLAAFTLPLLYSLFKARVDGTLHDAWSTASGRFAQLDRLPKVGAVAVPTLMLALLLSRVDLVIGILVILIFLRTVLQQSEVDTLSRKLVDPVSKTAAAAGKAVFNFAGDQAVRFDLTPTPSKKKAM